MRSATFLGILALSVWFNCEILAQEPDLQSEQQYPDTLNEADQPDRVELPGPSGQSNQQGLQRQKRQRGRQEPGGQKGQLRGGDRTANIAQMLKRMDRNGDDVISKDELPKRMQSRFETLDQNGDGALDKSEQAAMLERINELRGGQKKEPGPNGQPGAGPETQRRGINLPQLLEKMDKNADGQLTQDELPARMQERFQSMDSDGDGVIGKDEQLAMIERMQMRRDKGGKRKDAADAKGKQGVKPKRPGGDG
jgi:hypothetical protein